MPPNHWRRRQWVPATSAGTPAVASWPYIAASAVTHFAYSIYLFVNAMTTVSAVVFLYAPTTTLASVAALNMDDAGDMRRPQPWA